MNLYSYDFVNKNYDFLNYLFLVVMIVFGILLLFFGIKYLRNRTNLKFRDLLIILFFMVLLVIGIQISNISNNNYSHGRQTASMMRQISHDKHVSLKNIYTDSTTIKQGMMIKVNRKYYIVNLDANQTGYQLSKIKAIPNKVNYVNKNDFSLNIFNNLYLLLGLKLLIGFFVLVLQINLSGKSNVAQSTVIDQMQNYVLGGIIGGVLYNTSVTLLTFIIVLLLWSIIIFGWRILARNSKFFTRIMVGEPLTVIKNGHVNVDVLLRNGMTASDLMFYLRSLGVDNFRSVKNALFERNGTLTVQGNNDTITYTVIIDGEVDKENLADANVSVNQLKAALVRNGKHYDINQVFLASITNGDLSFVLYPQQNEVVIDKKLDVQN